MLKLLLHPLHERLNARFGLVDGAEVVDDYGDAPAEHAALISTVGVLDLGFRGRLCVTGTDRARFLHGQVTNKVKELQPGQGCYAALVSAKGKLQSDLYIHCLRDELLLDFEPGLTARVQQRLEQFIVADDVQLIDVAPHYGLLSVLGPAATDLFRHCGMDWTLPHQSLTSITVQDPVHGEIVIVQQSRGAVVGFDLFVPVPSLATVASALMHASKKAGGRPCGWQALERLRIESGHPRFGVDMDESNLAPETGLETRAISYDKGCYIGQEVINKLRTFAHVNKSLRGLRLPSSLPAVPMHGDKLVHEGKEVGHITSALTSPALGNIAMGYVRAPWNAPGTELKLRTATGEFSAQVVSLPFSR